MSVRRPLLELLTPEETDAIVGEACRTLATVGVLVEHAGSRALLREAGAEECGERSRIPEPLVRSAIASAPRRFTVFDRLGRPALEMGGEAVQFDPGSAAIHRLEAGSWRRRDATTADIAALVTLVEGLPHYAAQSTALAAGDVPREMADRWRLYVTLSLSVKPVVTGTFRADGFAPMLAMLEAVRGGARELRARPLALFDCCPSPPLKWSELTAQALVDCARSAVPATLVSMPLAGATAPVTLREAVVQHCAENLSGLAIHQLAGPGAPVTWGGAAAAFDMRQGTTPMGAVESLMIDLAAAQVGRSLALPTHAYMGLSEAKVPDYQAGLETGVGAVLAAAGGVNLVSGAGLLDYLLTQSLEKLLLDHEACGLALRLARGIERQEGDVVALLGELVGAGSLLGHPHTRANWRRELSVPSALIDRATYGDWEKAGGRWAHERAADEVARRLAGPPPEPLPAAVADELAAIVAAEGRRWGADTLPGLAPRAAGRGGPR
jgi:trimethylamine--corrinoid protein Co-methyltransferase